ncbi:MAG: hypothetical protein CMH48_10020 [Muricauda sp.]|nr:hypothetical protein [Allomuricauda sp.]MBC31168.1 hypothetical protein [Allomuricauda sp.]
MTSLGQVSSQKGKQWFYFKTGRIVGPFFVEIEFARGFSFKNCPLLAISLFGMNKKTALRCGRAVS